MKDCEVIATSQFKQKIAETEFLAPYVNDKDKEPIWDGSVHVYSATDKRVEHDIGRVPVQVKGRTVKKLPKDKITFDETHSNMVNFRNEGGVLYVVVKITPDNQKKMYYAKLMPFYINQLLSIYKDRKRVKFPLKLFPTDTKKVETIFYSFLQDRKKQPASLSGHNWTIEEIERQYRREDLKYEFSVPMHGYDLHDPMSYLLDDNDIYLYVRHMVSGEFFAIEHIANIEAGSHEINVKISANGMEYYNKAIFERHRSGDDYIKFGKSFEIKLCKNEEIAKFNYCLTGNLDERISALSFLIDMNIDSGFSIDGSKKEINLDEAKTKINIEENKHTLKYLKDVKKMLDMVGVKQPMEIGELTDKEEGFIKGLVLSFVYGGNLNFKEDTIPHVATMEFSNIKIVLVFDKNENGSYKLYNFFDEKCGFSVDKEGKIPTSQFTIFRRADYLSVSNMNLDVLMKSYQQYDNEFHIERVNISILEMIQAYDIDHRRTDLLDTAQSLSKWLSEKYSHNVIYEVNYLQCIRRRRELTNDEIKKLNGIANSAPDNEEIQFGVQVLLDNYRVARVYLDEMEDKKRDVIVSCPIYNFLKTHSSKNTGE